MSVIYFRVFGNAVTLTTHFVNSLIMLISINDELMLRDPEIRNLLTMQSRFLTVWNVAFQMAYAALALTCDVMTLMNKDHPKQIKKFREFFFSAIVLPGTLTVFTFFWPIFLYERSLIFPAFIDKVFTMSSNYVIHLAILPFALWELAFQPRIVPKSHKLNLMALAAYYTVYHIQCLFFNHAKTTEPIESLTTEYLALCWYLDGILQGTPKGIQLTYNSLGLWPYPLMYTIYRSVVYNICFHLFLMSLCTTVYFVQWPIVSLIWGKEKKISQKVK